MEEQRAGLSHVRFEPGRPGPVAVTFDPYTSVIALACDAVRELRRGSRSVTARIARTLTDDALRAVAPIIAPGRTLNPDCISPHDPTRDTNVADEIDRLRSLTSDDLHRDLERTYGSQTPPEHWVRVLEEPRRWAAGFASAVEQLWQVLAPTWNRSADRRHREADRIGAAVVRGGMGLVLAGAHPRGRIENDALVFPDSEGVVVDAGERTLVLAPMVGPHTSSICSLDRPDVVWFAYPLPAEAAPERDPAEDLDALLTPARARLLRALDTERGMGELAGMLVCSAAAATHHCDRLHAAGLLHRRREGRAVVVGRTARADRLLELFGT